MEVTIRAIQEDELPLFSSILLEGARWLAERGMTMWSEEQVAAEKLMKNHRMHEMMIGYYDGESAAVMILQEADAVMWPEDPPGEALYLHKLCVRRSFAQTGISQAMIDWAKLEAKQASKRYVKLDCAADRPALVSFYTRQGFLKVNERLMFGKYPTSFLEYKL
ncbi:GNAT family N-acetyltransferase [Paenibacillus sp. H1-7]|uniref:GNAT family N-acetyltransferase n=1 Tax=Paenibacillus sp. H1-7 TaxID=2282849 RepID=UPI001EF7C387|nr:GNAT family N-acetyltransferase [Paenibacillus sp. H1-7]ULL15660.1 GNAT family N-acetyltransferase [Paenibacillus sp. H1-7]